MITFENFNIGDDLPIYMQILRYIKRGIASGNIEDGDELPSRRVLSALIGVNPNTVQKAYRILEDEELIVSRSGAKSFIRLSGDATEKIRTELLTSDAKNLIDAMRGMGLSKNEAVKLIEMYWE